LPLKSFWQAVKAAGLQGVTITGATVPATVNGAWVYAGRVNAAPSWTNGTQVLYWDGATTWRIAATVGGAALYTRANAAYAGVYAAGTGTGTPTVAAVPCWYRKKFGDGTVNAAGEPVNTDVPQLVCYEFGAKNAENGRHYERYGVQVDCLHLSDEIAALRAQAVFDFFDAIKDTSSASAGWTMTGWRAPVIQVESLGVTHADELTGGAKLWHASVRVWLLSLYPTT
jgi:hypothetical protein